MSVLCRKHVGFMSVYYTKILQQLTKYQFVIAWVMSDVGSFYSFEDKKKISSTKCDTMSKKQSVVISP